MTTAVKPWLYAMAFGRVDCPLNFSRATQLRTKSTCKDKRQAIAPSKLDDRGHDNPWGGHVSAFPLPLLVNQLVSLRSRARPFPVNRHRLC